MDAKESNLWLDVGNKCLMKAEALLDSETVSTATTIETVKTLVETAIAIDMLNLRWEEQSRCGAAVLRGLTSERLKAGN